MFLPWFEFFFFNKVLPTEPVPIYLPTYRPSIFKENTLSELGCNAGNFLNIFSGEMVVLPRWRDWAVSRHWIVDAGLHFEVRLQLLEWLPSQKISILTFFSAASRSGKIKRDLEALGCNYLSTRHPGKLLGFLFIDYAPPGVLESTGVHSGARVLIKSDTSGARVAQWW